MIAYNKYTLQQLIDEVIIRLGGHRSAENVDWLTLATYINQGLEETMMAVMPLKEWAFTTSIEVQHLDVLDVNFIAPIRVLVSKTGQPPYQEARRIDVKEWFTIQNTEQRQQWNQSTYENPTYMVWGRVLYLHPSTTWDPTIPTTISGIMDCYTIPPRVYTPNGTLLMPYEYEELIILLAVERVLSRTMDNELLGELTQAIQRERNNVIEQYMKRQHAQKRTLESFVEPVAPLVQPKPEAGELPNKLV